MEMYSIVELKQIQYVNNRDHKNRVGPVGFGTFMVNKCYEQLR